ncbi:hypothetical protein MBLNU230_g4145t1 [Neophaeotheca triangularis]
MDPSQDSIAAFDPPPPPPDAPAFTTPRMAPASLHDHQATTDATGATNKPSSQSSQSQSQRATNMTPPPSTQVPVSSQSKMRTPTPPVSHISTPPPTNEALSQCRTPKVRIGGMTTEQIASAPAEELRMVVADLQTACQEANMSAAHYKLQYNMLSQESAAAIERMAVEAQMAQSETDIIHHAEQARAAATNAQVPTPEPGTISVAKEHYQSLIHQIQHLTDTSSSLKKDVAHHENLLGAQDSQIARLEDTVVMLRDRIRENREHVNRYRRANTIEATPRSVYSTPRKPYAQTHQGQPFEALLQASEMVSQEASSRPNASKRGHNRNTHSLSSLPSTPQRSSKTQKPSVIYQTPSHRQTKPIFPFTAPLPRTSALRTPDNIYAEPTLPVNTPTTNPRKHPRAPPAPTSDDGTVSEPDCAEDEDNDNDDSEAETDILEPDTIAVDASRASQAASRLLASDGQNRGSFTRDSPSAAAGISASTSSKGSLRQGTLFGSVRKIGAVSSAVDENGSPSKKARRGNGSVGLGIKGMGEE